MLHNLKILRESMNLNKKEMAKQLNIEERNYLNYENGKTEPKITQLIEIAEFFNVSLDYLCGKEENNFLPILKENEKEAIKMYCSLTNEQKSFINGEIKICYLSKTNNKKN